MNEKIFIIAGNVEQATNFRKKKIEQMVANGDDVSLSNFVIVHGPESFRGWNEVHGFFWGTYRDRPDIRDIVREIKRINGLHPSETVIPQMFVGRGLQRIHTMLPNPTKIP